MGWSSGGGRGWRARTELRGGSRAMQGSGAVVVEHVSAKEAAELAGLSTRTVRRWITEGRLRAEKRGRSFRIAVADLAAEVGRPLRVEAATADAERSVVLAGA